MSLWSLCKCYLVRKRVCKKKKFVILFFFGCCNNPMKQRIGGPNEPSNNFLNTGLQICKRKKLQKMFFVRDTVKVEMFADWISGVLKSFCGMSYLFSDICLDFWKVTTWGGCQCLNFSPPSKQHKSSTKIALIFYNCWLGERFRTSTRNKQQCKHNI